MNWHRRAVLLHVLIIWSCLQLTRAAGNGTITEDYSCDAISKVPADERCNFIRNSCPSEGLPYSEWYYCHMAKTYALVRWLYVGVICCLLPLAFCLLGDTAEFYIAPIMAHVSQAIPKMRPRFAGVTFVALGNGAPDLSANIAAISSGEITLSAGALTGAAMFVQCIVAAELVALAGPNGIKCGGAMLRDVGVYCLAIFSVLLAFALGKVSHTFVGWAITLYVVYMIWVFVGDEWHQRGRPRPRRLDIQSLKDMVAGVYPAGGVLGLQNRSEGGTAGTAAGAYTATGELNEALLPWAVAEEAEDVFYEPSGFEHAQRPPAVRGASGVSRSSAISSSLLSRYASTELSDLATVGSGGGYQASSADTSTGGAELNSAGDVPHGAAHDVGQPAGAAAPMEIPSHRSARPRVSAGFAQYPVQHHVQQPHFLSLGNQSYIDPKTYRQLVWADLADDQEEEIRWEREIAQQLIAGATRQTPAAPGGHYQPPQVQRSAVSQPLLSYRPAQQHQQQDQRLSEPGASAVDAAESGLLLSPFGPGAIRTLPSTPTADAAASPGVLPEAGALQQGGAVPPQGSNDLWQQLQWQVTLGNSEEWADSGPVQQLFRKVTFPLLLPAYLGQRLSIPFASASGYSREWLIAALLCCPLALVMYLGLFTLTAVLVACGCGITAAVVAAALTRWDAPGQLPVQGMGGMAAAIVPGVLAVLAFVMGIVWIDTIATQVVGVLTFVAGLASLPSGVMGLTLLAWGSSLGDFFGNRAMARAGHGSTAITACFAAPLFNMLMSLSLGFSSYFHKIGHKSVSVRLTPEVALGCVFLMGYNVSIICIGRWCGQRLPPWFAYYARAWYALYFSVAVFFGFYSSH